LNSLGKKYYPGNLLEFFGTPENFVVLDVIFARNIAVISYKYFDMSELILSAN